MPKFVPPGKPTPFEIGNDEMGRITVPKCGFMTNAEAKRYQEAKTDIEYAQIILDRDPEIAGLVLELPMPLTTAIAYFAINEAMAWKKPIDLYKGFEEPEEPATGEAATEGE